MDWNTDDNVEYVRGASFESHLIQVCGLKLPRRQPKPAEVSGHTLYRCVDWNMKLVCRSWPFTYGHTLYRCVDWNIIRNTIITITAVTPYTGVWIETLMSCRHRSLSLSHLIQVCGLKLPGLLGYAEVRQSHLIQVCGLKLLHHRRKEEQGLVTPYTGVWIETTHGVVNVKANMTSHLIQVCGLKHRHVPVKIRLDRLASHLIQVCGLKPYIHPFGNSDFIFCHTLYRCVDWNSVSRNTWTL